MNQPWEEKEIEKLFRELRQADERLAPPFAATWQGALSRSGENRRAGILLRVALAALALVMVSASLLFYLAGRGVNPIEVRVPNAPALSEIVDVPPSTTAALTEGKPWPRTHAVHRRPPAVLVSQWRSPTEFLLRFPGEQPVLTLPRLSDSIITIRAIMPENNN